MLSYLERRQLDELTALALSEQEFGELLIAGRGTDSLVYLRDVAEIRRGYREPATSYLRYDQEPAIGLAISTIDGGNVVTMGESINARLDEIRGEIPLGMELQPISLQNEADSSSASSFSSPSWGRSSSWTCRASSWSASPSVPW